MTLRVALVNLIRQLTNQGSYKIPVRFLLSISLVDYLWNLIPNNGLEDKIVQYWRYRPLPKILEEADDNLKNEEFMKVYEMLNRLKYSREIGAIWRAVKALYNLSLNPELSEDVRKAMIQESYEILMNAAPVGEGKPYYHKWLAIILNARNGMDSLESKVIGYPEVRDHLKLACQTNPKDFTSLFTTFGALYFSYNCFQLVAICINYISTSKFYDYIKASSAYQRNLRNISNIDRLTASVLFVNSIRQRCVNPTKIKKSRNPVQHMLGKWHYEMANLTWFQRLLARYFFEEPPKSNFEEAYKYLNKAEELLPRTYLPNVFLLGCACIHLGQYYRAKYYLNMAINLPTHSDCDKCCSTNAKRLLAKLEKYDLGKDLLYESYHNFGFTS